MRKGDLALAVERRIDRVFGPPLVVLLALFAPRPVRDKSPPRRILLVKLHGIGNLVMLAPVARQIRRAFPGAEIDFLTFSANRGIFAGMAEVATVHRLERGDPLSFMFSFFRVLGPLRARRYDLAIDFDQFAHLSAVMVLLVGAPRRVGFRNPTLRRHLAYTVPVVLLDRDHVSRSFAYLAAAAGAPAEPAPPRILDLGPEAEAEALAWLGTEGIGSGERLVLLHPGTSANLLLRRWPSGRFARLGDLLVSRLGARAVVTGGAEETELAEEVRAGMTQPAASAAGRLSLPGFAALCRRAALVVANDTAAVHVASAMGTRVAGLYGPNTPFLYGPLGERDLVFYHRLPCSPCLSNFTCKLSTCRRARCMEAITVEEVFAAIEKEGLA
jgi:heptosyltransferase-3